MVSTPPPWNSGYCIQVWVSRGFEIHNLNMMIQGVIQKDPRLGFVVNNARAVVAQGTRLRQDRRDDDDDFDL
jgi:hypothetical protein